MTNETKSTYKTAARPEESRNRLRLVSLVNLIVANMIGAGVFTTSGLALADLGSPDRVMLAWLIGGSIAFCGALSYRGLVRHFTQSGGEYLFLSQAVHPLVGFVAGWVSLLAGFTGSGKSSGLPVCPGVFCRRNRFLGDSRGLAQSGGTSSKSHS